jgi:hypothetical protein
MFLRQIVISKDNSDNRKQSGRLWPCSPVIGMGANSIKPPFFQKNFSITAIICKFA